MEVKDYERLLVFLIVVICLLLFTLGTEWYSINKEEKRIELNQTITKSYNEGIQYGYLIAITQVMSNSQGCKIVPLNYDNITVYMVDVNCKIGGE